MDYLPFTVTMDYSLLTVDNWILDSNLILRSIAVAFPFFASYSDVKDWKEIRRHRLREMMKQIRNTVLLMGLMEVTIAGPQMVYAGNDGDFGVCLPSFARFQRPNMRERYTDNGYRLFTPSDIFSAGSTSALSRSSPSLSSA